MNNIARAQYQSHGFHLVEPSPWQYTGNVLNIRRFSSNSSNITESIFFKPLLPFFYKKKGTRHREFNSTITYY